jgi:hypothetical protein
MCRSSVAYVADAGRWVVGIGDWNSKMEKRLSQISELVLLANTLLTEYAVTGVVGAEGCREELDAYLQILSATVTLKNAPANGKASTDGRPLVRAQAPTAAEFSTEMSALGTEIGGAFSEIFGNKDLGRSASSGTIGQASRARTSARADADNDAMNPFTPSYRRPMDPYATAATSSAGASVSSSVQSLPDATGAPTVGTGQEYPLSDGDTPEGPLSPVSMGEYECLDMDSIPKYAAFKSSAQLAARRQYAPGSGNGSLATSMTSDGGRSVFSESSAEYQDLFPLPPSSAQAASRSLSSLATTASLKKKPPTKPIMDMNYSYDFQCEAEHNPFLSPDTPGPVVSPPAEKDFQEPIGVAQQPAPSPAHPPTPPVDGYADSTQAPSSEATTTATASPATNAGAESCLPSAANSTTVAVAASTPPVLGTLSPPPVLHAAIDYTQAVPSSVQVATAQSWTAASVPSHIVSEEDETEALVAALRASTAEQQGHPDHDSEHEYDLFGVGKP